ncbi:hypothetical protein LTR37_020202 [Vermiconidia calcicola]|uniref:Uncharacterized protein n=1 Tax=Vermiconidia calcicola TaxID=1690605 RepID=A0ACC3MBZ3_9PEZI|nr:hypothetical protein LTR37_020202 [Vermiconidia calcicola]
MNAFHTYCDSDSLLESATYVFYDLQLRYRELITTRSTDQLLHHARQAVSPWGCRSAEVHVIAHWAPVEEDSDSDSEAGSEDGSEDGEQNGEHDGEHDGEQDGEHGAYGDLHREIRLLTACSRRADEQVADLRDADFQVTDLQAADFQAALRRAAVVSVTGLQAALVQPTISKDASQSSVENGTVEEAEASVIQAVAVY